MKRAVQTTHQSIGSSEVLEFAHALLGNPLPDLRLVRESRGPTGARPVAGRDHGPA
jgi:hypothetical protein